MKVCKKPVVVEAHQWFKNGDHPQDNPEGVLLTTCPPQKPEGKVVRYYRHPRMDGANACTHCGVRMHDHGWIDTYEGGHIVCPGDWVIKGVAGEFYPVKPDIFERTYEVVA